MNTFKMKYVFSLLWLL